MAGIYGDMLLAWPEQHTEITVYEMQPKINGGWEEPENAKVVRGIYQHTGGKNLKENNGNLAQSSAVEFWTTEGGLNGFFTIIENNVYRLAGDNQWKTEGGFYRYSLQKVIGNDGTESDDTTWNTGTNNFG